MSPIGRGEVTLSMVLFSGRFAVKSYYEVCSLLRYTIHRPNRSIVLRSASKGLIADGIYYVYPYIAPAPAPPAPRRMYMGSLFTNNAQVYYKSNSLSTGSGGSGVKNSRHKQRRT